MAEFALPYSKSHCSLASRLLLAALLATASHSLHAAIAQPVRTEAGMVTGSAGRDASISVYKGIPYAAPPVGQLRWKPPQPAARWEGIRKAEQFSDTCAQPARGETAKLPLSEDCLYLNVWTGAAAANEKRPVLVWMYGGGYMLGSAASPAYDGEGLARKGVVVVTINYRLGPFGFLATPELSKESGRNASGNYGLLDMIASLRWVQRNIAAFGGDPDKVTIAGQSSGGGSVLLLAQSPLAKGLFHGIIAQSGARAIGDPMFVQVRTRTANEQRGARFGAERGARTLQEMRALTWQQVLTNVELTKGDPGEDGDASLPVFRPTIDGWVLPLPIGETYARGMQFDVPVMTGFNHDEMGATPSPKVTLAALHESARKTYGAMTDELFKLYPANNDAEAGAAQNAFSRDRNRTTSYFWASAWKQKARSNVYLYYWAHAPQDVRGAFHGAEIRYAFNTLDLLDTPVVAQDRKVADIISSYYANFIKHGDPNGSGLPRWPAFDGAPEIMVLGGSFNTMPVAEPAKLDFMKRFYASQKAW